VVGVEFWSPSPSPPCNLPDLPKPMSDHNVDLVQDQVITCYLDSCYHLTETGWQPGPNTLHYRQFHSSVVINDKLLLLGGVLAPNSTEFVAGPNSESAEAFSLNPPIMDHCSVKVGSDALVITGGQDETFTVRDTVTEYSNIDQELVSSRQLPDLLTARLYHACAAYTVDGAQVVLTLVRIRQMSSLS